VSARRGIRAAGAVAIALSVTFGSVAAALAAHRAPPVRPGPAALAPIPAREPTQVVVFDRQLKTTTVVSRDQGAQPGQAPSSRPSISADGAFIAFQSDAGLLTTDTDGATDVYLWDRALGGVQLVSQRPGGGGSNGASRNPAISADASTVAFASTSTDITTDQGLGDGTQVFAWQRLTGNVSLASVAADGGGASGASGDPAISGDGRVVAFESTGDDLVAGDTNDVRDVFLRDVARGATIRASISNGGRQAGAESRRASVSGDGGAVVFDSTANLGPNDTNQARDVYLRDLPPAVTVTPNPLDFGLVPLGTPANGSVIVLSHGWTPVTLLPSTVSGANAGDFVVAGDACAGFVLPYGATCSIAVVDIPAAEGPRVATLEVNSSALDSPTLVELKGGVPAPALRFEPAVGPPGAVAILFATNLPPGASFSVAWDRGITQFMPQPLVAGPDGTAVVQVLVFHHDVIGLRQLVVTALPGGPGFTVAPLEFLVVPPPLQPPGQSAISFLNPDLQLIPSRR
jgi:hypothetical protein